MIESSLVLQKSFQFSIRIVRLYKYLITEKREYVMSKQLLKSGTSIGANLREAKYAQSTLDFINKNSIALKEASETEYWLELLYCTDYLDDEGYSSIISDCNEIARLLVSIVKTSKETTNKKLDN